MMTDGIMTDGISRDGRWHGAVTSRPLPEDDSIAELSSRERCMLADVWLGRAASERRVADSFVVVRDALASLDAAEELVDLATRAIDDEMRHAELSRDVASRYACEPLAHPPRLALAIPLHAGASERLRHVLHVVGQCAFNETIASAFLEAALAEATAPLARAALRELLSDEIDHARLGWALLGTLDRELLREVDAWLAAMAIANLRMWREAHRAYACDAKLAMHGAPSVESVENALILAFRDLILPGFEHLGMKTEAMRTWLEAGAPTRLTR
jgi:hypothetical protein